MQSKSFLLLTLVFILSSSPAWGKKPDYSSLKVGDVEKVDIDDLHPTQFNIGKQEEKEKAENFEDMTSKQLRKYLEKHPCPVVIGPEGTPYITDEQHRANAAEEAETGHHDVAALQRKGEPTMYMKVIDTYDGPAGKFGEWMVKHHYTYLRDEGKLRPFSDLPKHVDDMGNDPYRSLAGFLEDTYYKTDDVFFAQFDVAQWLRDNLEMSDKEITHELKNNKKHFLKKVGKLLESRKAAHEPWYQSCDSLLGHG